VVHDLIGFRSTQKGTLLCVNPIPHFPTLQGSRAFLQQAAAWVRDYKQAFSRRMDRRLTMQENTRDYQVLIGVSIALGLCP
jgi:hypothetical protein